MENREHKFRAWDKKNKEWFKTELSFYGFHIFGECMLVCPPRLYDLEHLEISQGTGLKDKDGKEIYEGDIIKIDAVGIYKEGIGKIIWKEWESTNDLKFNWMRVQAGWTIETKCHQIWTERTIEIIGNIYENPELIKE